MALIKCPECGGIVSDKAPSCPHCGFPLEASISVQENENVASEHEKEKNEIDNISELSNQENMDTESQNPVENLASNDCDDPLTLIHKLGSEMDDFHNWVQNNKPPKEFGTGVTLGQAAFSQMGMLGVAGALLILRPRYNKLLKKPYFKNMTFDDMIVDICEKTDQMVALGKKCQEELSKDDPAYYGISTYIAEHCTYYALDWFNFFCQPAMQKVEIGGKELAYSTHVFNRVKEEVSSLDLSKDSLKLLAEIA